MHCNEISLSITTGIHDFCLLDKIDNANLAPVQICCFTSILHSHGSGCLVQEGAQSKPPPRDSHPIRPTLIPFNATSIKDGIIVMIQAIVLYMDKVKISKTTHGSFQVMLPLKTVRYVFDNDASSRHCWSR